MLMHLFYGLVSLASVFGNATLAFHVGNTHSLAPQIHVIVICKQTTASC